MKAITHLEKVIAGEVSAVTHLEKVIAQETTAVTYTEKVIAGEAPPVTHLQKVIAGEARPVTHLEYVWAGGSPASVQEYTGAVPVTFIADGTPLLDYLISGNAAQSGTPTPDNPIMPQGTGERTGNVMPAGEQKTIENNGITFSSDGKGKYSISGTAIAYASARFNLLSAFTTPISVSNGGQGTLSFFNTQSDNNVTFIFYNGTTKVDDWKLTPSNRAITAYNAIGNKYVNSIVITVNPGATVDMTITPEFTNDGVIPESFEKYGYKIPISSANTTTPVYLGEVETTRKIKKLVLTGGANEDLRKNNQDPSNYLYYLRLTVDNIGARDCLCTHLMWRTGAPTDSIGCNANLPRIIYMNFGADIMDAQTSGNTVEGLKEYLAAQYAAGTPVTVWYVLATEETAVVNESLMRIGDYADTISMEQAGVSIPTANGSTTLDVETTVPPSEVYIKYRGEAVTTLSTLSAEVSSPEATEEVNPEETEEEENGSEDISLQHEFEAIE